MNAERPVQLGKWYGLLIFATGSVLTGIAARVAPYYNGNPLLVMILVYWMISGLATGLWIIRGRSWQALAHDARLRLGLAYLGIGWAGLFGLTLDSSIVNIVILAPGIGLAIVFIASMIDSRQGKRDEGDLFP